MSRRMIAIEVFVNQDNEIALKTNDQGGETCIAIPLDQIDTVIEWMQEAREEALEFRVEELRANA